MRQALELALEALQVATTPLAKDRQEVLQAITAIKEALAQPEQEPVAWMLEGWGPDCGPYFEIYRDDEMGWRNKKEWTPLYTTPPQRTWVGLTDEEIADCAEKMEASDPTDSFWREFFRGLEAKLKDKNL